MWGKDGNAGSEFLPGIVHVARLGWDGMGLSLLGGGQDGAGDEMRLERKREREEEDRDGLDA